MPIKIAKRSSFFLAKSQGGIGVGGSHGGMVVMRLIDAAVFLVEAEGMLKGSLYLFGTL